MYFWNAKSDDDTFNGLNFHIHKECEIYYMVDGEVEFRIEGNVFHLVTDSLLTIPANSFHQWIYPPGKIHHRINVHFLPELLNKTERESFFEFLFRTSAFFKWVSIRS